MRNTTDSRSVTSKLAAILQVFAAGSEHSLTEIARSANLPVSTAHRLTIELAEWQILERTEDKRYRMGALLAHLTTPVWHEPTVVDHARRVLDDLTAATRATARLGILDDLAVAYVEKQPGAPSPRPAFAAQTLPAHATAMGKALLAFSPRATVERVIDNGLDRFTASTIVTGPALRRALATTRVTQVAMTRQELCPGTAAVAVPVFGCGGVLVAALEVTLNGAGHPLRHLQAAVTVAARALSHELVASRLRRVPRALTALLPPSA